MEREMMNSHTFRRLGLRRPSVKGSPLSGFTLVELLLVMAIIIAMTALMGPVISGILGGSQVSAGVETVQGALTTARQIAATKNRLVEFRLISMKDPANPLSSSAIRAVQILENRESGLTPIGKLRPLPSGIIIGTNTALTSLAALVTNNGDMRLPNVGTGYTYGCFHFKQDGSTDLLTLVPGTNAIMTLYDGKMPGTPPKNFATLMIEPATGTAVLYRP